MKKMIIIEMARTLRTVMFTLVGLVVFCCSLSCEKKELDIQANFPFEVKVMPVPGEVAKGQTVEIRVTIISKGNYKDVDYFIRYFQNEGQGLLRYYSTPPYLPNDIYGLPEKEFRLYYTSDSVVKQSFEVWISDNFGNEKQLSFQFNSSD